jgi:hypothetical protein
MSNPTRYSCGDIRLKTPGHGLQEKIICGPGSSSTAPPATPTKKVTPAQPGESCLDAEGNIDWARIPVRPPGLPSTVTFRAWPAKGVWRADFIQSQ